jgi:fumarate reductase subunit D
MKKIIYLFLLLAVAVFPIIALADPDVPAAVTPQSVTPIPNTNFENTIGFLTNWFFAILLVVAVWFLLWAGFTFVTANGEPDKITKARSQVMYGLIGVLVAVMAKGIVGFAMGLAR